MIIRNWVSVDLQMLVFTSITKFKFFGVSAVSNELRPKFYVRFSADILFYTLSETLGRALSKESNSQV